MAAEAEQADKTLLGDWRFEEGGGDVAGDSSGHGNDGEILRRRLGARASSAPPCTSEAATRMSPSPESPRSTDPLNSRSRPGCTGSKAGKYPNIITGGTWCPGGFLFFVADNGCSFRLGKPGKVPLQVGKDWAETSASFVQFTPGQWYHLAATFKRPHVQTYVNGKAVGHRGLGLPHWVFR